MVTEELRKWVKEWVAGWAKNMFFTRADHKMTSSGTSSHGLPVILDNIGKIDASFLDSEDIGAILAAATAKVTPVDADTMPLNDSAASNALKKVTWANIKATLKTYFDGLYVELTGDTMSGALNVVESDSTAYVSSDGTHNTSFSAENTSNTDSSSAGVSFRVNNAGAAIQRAWVGFVSRASGFGPNFVVKIRNGASSYFEALYIAGSTGDITIFGSLLSPTIVTPTIASFTNAQHNHTNAAGGGVLGTSALSNDAVTFAKMQDIATDSLIGRDTASTGDPENITLNATLSMTGTGALQRAALTGDVTASAGSNATTIASDVVDNTKLANMAQATIKGRASGAGTGDPTDLSAAQVATIVNASIDHGTLTGNGDDDHTHYMHNSTARTVSARHTMTDGAEFSRASYPVILVTRTGSAAGLQATFGFKYTKSTASADGDGPRMIFEINDDSTTTQNIVAGIGAARDGADNSADVVVQAATAGTVAEVARFHKEGDATITGVLNATGVNVGEDTMSRFDEVTTFTPTITGSGSNPTVTYTVQTCRYLRVNDWIHFQCQISWSSASGGSGNARFTLPVACAALNQTVAGWYALSTIGSYPSAFPMASGNSYGSLYVPGTDNTVITVANVTGGSGGVIYGGSYYVGS